MEVRSDWYNRTVKSINLYKDTLGKKDAKKHKLDLLLRIAGRVDYFAGYCGECENFRQEIRRLTEELGNLVQVPDEAGRKSYNKTINGIVKHLQKVHKLVPSGYYMGICMAIGTGIGVALGAALGNPGIGTPLGIGLGLAIGSYLDKKAKKEDRVI